MWSWSLWKTLFFSLWSNHMEFSTPTTQADTVPPHFQKPPQNSPVPEIPTWMSMWMCVGYCGEWVRNCACACVSVWLCSCLCMCWTQKSAPMFPCFIALCVYMLELCFICVNPALPWFIRLPCFIGLCLNVSMFINCFFCVYIMLQCFIALCFNVSMFYCFEFIIMLPCFIGVVFLC